MRRWQLAGPFVMALGTFVACGIDDHLDCTDDEFGKDICGIFGDAGDGADTGVTPDGGKPVEGGVVTPPECDLTKDPKDSPACVSDEVGAFVSPRGKDGARGTKSDPVKSISEAIAQGKPRVYVCEGTYEEALKITRSVALYGGLTCEWQSSDARPKVAPAKGVAATIANVDGSVVVQDLEFVGAADVSKPGDSAVAAFVSGSKNVTFRNTNLTALNGVAGAGGGSRSNYSGGPATKGGNANGSTAGAGASCTCVDATSSKGGNGAAGNGADVSDGSSVPASGSPNAGNSNTTTCTDGTAGANGSAGGSGGTETSLGTLSAAGWTPPPKAPNAPNGRPGQGGGGGGAKTNINSGGGGGACGGCGGAGGEGGVSGGSSFALLSFESTVRVEGGHLGTGTGGVGGTGAVGQSGQAGGEQGAGACDGGSGGHGAGGSGGGGGAGGHSVPIAYVGAEPHVEGAELAPGTKGDGGAGGAGGAGSGVTGPQGPQGPSGKAQNVLAL